MDEAEISSVGARGRARREWRLSAPPYNLPLPVYSPPLSRGSARDKEAKSVATFSFHEVNYFSTMLITRKFAAI